MIEQVQRQFGVSYNDAIKMGPRKFVNNHLFPFMRRENSNGFAMSMWRNNLHSFLYQENPIFYGDGIKHGVPACGTAGCIGGSMEIVLGLPIHGATTSMLGKILGITEKQAGGLFFRWRDNQIDASDKTGWSKHFRRLFTEGKSPQEKEQVAERVILRAIKTHGKSLQLTK